MSTDAEALARLLSDYDLGRDLGEGAFGRVVQARHRQLGRDVAVKLLAGPVAADPEHTARFRREARVLAQLDHPHVTRVYDYREDGGMHVLVMELLTGGSLREHMDRGISAETAVAATIAAGAGLHHVHTQGVLHRDVKPANLMFDAKGTLKVADFGLARGDDPMLTEVHLTTGGHLMGTPAYMAPEQIGGEDVGPAADEYALAAVLYEMLAGRLTHPSDGGTMRMLARRVNEPAQPLRAVAPGVPAEVADAVAVALATDPSRRFASVEAFCLALAHGGCAAWGPDWLDRSKVGVRESGPIRDAAEGRDRRPSSPATPQPATPSAVQSPVVPSPVPVALPGSVAPAAPVPSAPVAPVAPYASAPQGPRASRGRGWIVGAVGLAALAAAVVGVVIVSTGDDTSDPPGSTDEVVSGPPTSLALVEDWAASIGTDVFSSPALSGASVVVGSDDGRLHVLDAATGAEQRTFVTGGSVRSSPLVVGDVAVFGSDDGKLYAVGVEDGAERWSQSLGYQIVSSPATDGSTVVVGADQLYAFDLATGDPRWQAPTGDLVISSPAVADGVAVVGTKGGDVVAVDLASGDVRWTHPLGGPVLSSPVVVDGVAYVGCDDGHLYGLRLSDGEVVVDPDLGGKVYSSPAVAGDAVVVGVSQGAQGALVAVDRSTGEEIWRVEAAAVDSSPAVAGDLVAVGTTGAEVMVVSASTGEVVATATVGGAVRSSPAFGDGSLFVGSSDGKLYAMSGWESP